MNIVAVTFQPNCLNYIQATLSCFKNSKKIILDKSFYQNKHKRALSFIKKKIIKKNYILISGTSSTDSFEKKLRKLFYSKNLPVFIILDSTFNLKKRFIRDDFTKPKIFVNDKYAKIKLIQNKFSNKNVFNYGNIYLEKLLKKNKPISNLKSKKVLMISQPLSERKKKFNEITCFKILYNFCNKNSLNLEVKIHPREKQNKWHELSKNFKFNIILKNFKNINLKSYKFIFGINTEGFLECVTMNRNIFAINFTKTYNDNYCIRNKLVKTIKNRMQLDNIFLNKYKIKITKLKKITVGKKIFNQIINETKKIF